MQQHVAHLKKHILEGGYDRVTRQYAPLLIDLQRQYHGTPLVYYISELSSDSRWRSMHVITHHIAGTVNLPFVPQIIRLNLPFL